MSDGRCFWRQKKYWLVFFGAFFSGAGAGFSLFASMKMKSADACVNLRQQQKLTRSAETNSVSSRPSGGVNSGVF
jgi:hypothetical protein